MDSQLDLQRWLHKYFMAFNIVPIYFNVCDYWSSNDQPINRLIHQ